MGTSSFSFTVSYVFKVCDMLFGSSDRDGHTHREARTAVKSVNVGIISHSCCVCAGMICVLVRLLSRYRANGIDVYLKGSLLSNNSANHKVPQ